MNEPGNWLTNALAQLESRPYLQAAAGVLVCIVLALLADWVVRTALRRSVGQWPEWSIERLGHVARQAVFSTVVLLGVMWIIGAVELAPRPEAIALAVSKTLVIVAWLFFGVRIIRILLDALGRRPVPPPIAQPTTATLVRNAVTVILGLTGLYAVLVAWDVNVTGLIASAGIIGLALSLAAQDTLSNLVAGIAILTDKPYRIGDYIVLDTGERGAVTAIGLRSTRLLTRDDVEVSIPNGVMGRAKIVNESGSPERKYRLRVPVRVSYGSDIDKVMALMLATAAEHPQVCDAPEPRMRLRTFGDSGLEFEMLCWIDQPANRGLVLHELNCSIYRIFAREGIVMPLPQQEIHLRERPATPS
jgi:small-conductance mechanosensitive channel